MKWPRLLATASLLLAVLPAPVVAGVCLEYLEQHVGDPSWEKRCLEELEAGDSPAGFGALESGTSSMASTASLVELVPARHVGASNPVAAQNQNEVILAVDPSVPCTPGPNGSGRAFLFSNTHPFLAGGGTDPGLFAAYSSDCGWSWTAYRLGDDPGGMPIEPARPRGDPWAVFTETGKLYIAYFVDVELASMVAVSSDGGASFTPVETLPDGGGDRQSIAAGPDGSVAPGSLWLVFADDGIKASGAALDANGDPIVDGECEPEPRVFCENQTVATGAFFPGHISIGPNGEVLVTYHEVGPSAGPSRIFAAIDPDGLGEEGFCMPQEIPESPSNVGAREIIPPHSVRRVQPLPNLAWDRASGSVYLAWVSEEPQNSDDTEIMLSVGSVVPHPDPGPGDCSVLVEWAPAVTVNDDTTGSQFLPAVAVDQESGHVAVAWQDPRNDPGNVETEAFVAVSTDGGQTFANRALSYGFSRATDTETSHGEYLGVAFHDGIANVAWVDNSNVVAPGVAEDNTDPDCNGTGVPCMDVFFAPEPGLHASLLAGAAVLALCRSRCARIRF